MGSRSNSPPKIHQPGAGEQAVYKIRVQGVADGPQRFQIQLVTAETPIPVTKEEITRVYLDK